MRILRPRHRDNAAARNGLVPGSSLTSLSSMRRPIVGVWHPSDDRLIGRRSAIRDLSAAPRFNSPTAYGASRPLPSVSTKVRLLNRLPTLDLGGGNYSSCPLAVIDGREMQITLATASLAMLISLRSSSAEAAVD